MSLDTVMRASSYSRSAKRSSPRSDAASAIALTAVPTLPRSPLAAALAGSSTSFCLVNWSVPSFPLCTLLDADVCRLFPRRAFRCRRPRSLAGLSRLRRRLAAGSRDRFRVSGLLLQPAGERGGATAGRAGGVDASLLAALGRLTAGCDARSAAALTRPASCGRQDANAFAISSPVAVAPAWYTHQRIPLGPIP